MAVFCAQVCVAGRTGFVSRIVMCGVWINQHLLSGRSCRSGEQRQDNLCFDDFHLCSTNGTGDGGSFFLSAGKHAERIEPQYHLEEFNEFLAAGMKKSITPSSAKTLRTWRMSR